MLDDVVHHDRVIAIRRQTQRIERAAMHGDAACGKRMRARVRVHVLAFHDPSLRVQPQQSAAAAAATSSNPAGLHSAQVALVGQTAGTRGAGRVQQHAVGSAEPGAPPTVHEGSS